MYESFLNSSHIVTLLGPALSSEVVEGVANEFAGHGLSVDRVEMMSEPGLSPAETSSAPGSPATVCLRLLVSGTPRDEAALRAALLVFSDKLDESAIDLVMQRGDSLFADGGLEGRLFAFDMDSTLIQGEVIDELARLAGVADRVVDITASAMRGEIEFQESFRRRVALLEGLPASRADELLDRIPLMGGAERLFRTLKRLGAKTAILSGGFTFFGAFLQEKLGVDYVFANELDIAGGWADGWVTGAVRGPIVDGARKAELLREIAAGEKIPLERAVAVGDGANDLPMLQLAGMGVAFHAKPVVRASVAYSITHAGLDSLLYLLGLPERRWAEQAG